MERLQQQEHWTAPMQQAPLPPSAGGTMWAIGVNGQIEVDKNWVTIRRRGVLAFATQGLKGEKRIPLASITTVQMKKPGLSNGYLQLAVLGGIEARGGVFDATKDENTVMFGHAQTPEFERIRRYIEDVIIQRANPTAAALAPVSVADELGKLAALRDAGVLTDEEFQQQKHRLLG
jgi:hypothetical protein